MAGYNNNKKTALVAAIIFIGGMTSLLAVSTLNLMLMYQDAYAYSRSHLQDDNDKPLSNMG